MVFRCTRHGLAAFLSLPVLMLYLAPAQAADRTDEEVTAPSEDYASASRNVAIGDLNLALPEDQQRLRHRISVAARHVCLEAGGGTAIQDDSQLACYQTSMHDAWAVAQERIQVASAKASLFARSQPQAPFQVQEIASSGTGR
nr:UrcA family protein [uncultured Lichenicoccus sp.]